MQLLHEVRQVLGIAVPEITFDRRVQAYARHEASYMEFAFCVNDPCEDFVT
jgi:hypothetical protein